VYTTPRHSSDNPQRRLLTPPAAGPTGGAPLSYRQWRLRGGGGHCGRISLLIAAVAGRAQKQSASRACCGGGGRAGGGH